MSIVAVIPARAGSKRIKGKNKKLLNGKPLFEYSVEQALQCDFINEIILTTDDEDIIELAQKYGYDERFRVHKRSKWLAQDETTTEAVLLDIFKNYDISTTIILLQPTSPMRSVFQISHAFEIYKERVRCPLISVKRNDPKKRFEHNGAIYIFSLAQLHCSSIVGGEFMCVYFMDKKSSIDIDELKDFELAERYLRERNER